MKILYKREDILLHDSIHLARREIMEHRPLELLTVNLTLTDSHLTVEDTLKGQAEKCTLFSFEIIRIIKVTINIR